MQAHEYNTRFAAYLAIAALRHENFDASDLNPNFVYAFNKGRNYRIKVRFPDHVERWGTLGVTTGWKPAFILLYNRIAISSPHLIGEGCVIGDSKTLKGWTS